MPSPGPHPLPARAGGPGHPRDSGVAGGLRGADLLRLDDLEAVRVGRDRASRRLPRMRRALSEYEVRGIKTTIPFFQWILDRPTTSLAGRFDTTYLDDVLVQRKGEPFVEHAGRGRGRRRARRRRSAVWPPARRTVGARRTPTGARATQSALAAGRPAGRAAAGMSGGTRR